jgi:hypothetical protein
MWFKISMDISQLIALQPGHISEKNGHGDKTININSGKADKRIRVARFFSHNIPKREKYTK